MMRGGVGEAGEPAHRAGHGALVPPPAAAGPAPNVFVPWRRSQRRRHKEI